MGPYLEDHRHLFHGRALAVVRPATTDEVSRVLALCHARGVGVVPQGGNTSYCGGATPDESGTQVVLALARMNRIRSTDPDNDSLVAEAGCTLAQVHSAAEAAGRLFPLRLGSEGSCQIGGNLSTNAGGTQVLRYGMMRELVLGLEVVLADGRVLESLTSLRKDNTGYDLKGLFLGAEGTLGVITAASLRLFPPTVATATALIAVPDVAAAVRLLARMRAASSGRVSAFELMPAAAVELAAQHLEGVRRPFATPHPWYVLAELTSSCPGDALDTLLATALTAAVEAGEAHDALLAQSERERAAFWFLREHIPEAQRRAGASLKHDISVPVSRLAGFVERAGAWIAAHVPEGLLVAYGHVGDGNLHFNVSARPGSDGAALLSRAGEVRRVVHDLVRDFGGSFSAEHGIGQLKVGELERYTSAVELELMHTLKRALDPRGIMNPGKVLAATTAGRA
ncbi:MAG: FAD-binding oxidoreductase [Proteobacteria bacterium]|nr:FAD-binding oxidoreductase [Pseudomonadota bacterium]